MNAARHFHRMQIDDCNKIVRSARYEGSLTVRLHNDAGRAVPHGNLLNRLLGPDIDDGHVSTAQHRDQRKLSVERELQPVRAA